jgi:hypothetical protein
MPYNILHVTPYMHASAGGPPVVVENFIAEANRLGHSSEIVSTLDYCNGDESTLQKRLAQLVGVGPRRSTRMCGELTSFTSIRFGAL